MGKDGVRDYIAEADQLIADIYKKHDEEQLIKGHMHHISKVGDKIELGTYGEPSIDEYSVKYKSHNEHWASKSGKAIMSTVEGKPWTIPKGIKWGSNPENSNIINNVIMTDGKTDTITFKGAEWKADDNVHPSQIWKDSINTTLFNDAEKYKYIKTTVKAKETYEELLINSGVGIQTDVEGNLVNKGKLVKVSEPITSLKQMYGMIKENE